MGRTWGTGQFKAVAILEAALDQFARHGFDGTSMRKVASLAQVPVGTVYAYLGSKEVIFNKVYESCALELRRHLFSELRRDGDARSEFGLLWGRLFAFQRNCLLELAVLELQWHHPHLSEENHRREGRLLEPFREVLDRAKEEGLLGTLPTDVMLAIIWGTFSGLVRAGFAKAVSLTKEVVEDSEESCWRALEARTDDSERRALDAFLDGVDLTPDSSAR